MKSFLKHIADWFEAYLVLPFSIFAISLANWYYYFQTGRSPTIAEGGLDWITGMVPRIVAITVAIIFVSIFKQATGAWMSKEEQLSNPAMAIADKAGRILMFAILLHYLSN